MLVIPKDQKIDKVSDKGSTPFETVSSSSMPGASKPTNLIVNMDLETDCPLGIIISITVFLIAPFQIIKDGRIRL